MSGQWHCVIDGRQVGPVSLERLQQLASAGRLMPDHKVRRDADTDWIYARNVAEIFPNVAISSDRSEESAAPKRPTPPVPQGPAVAPPPRAKSKQPIPITPPTPAPAGTVPTLVMPASPTAVRRPGNAKKKPADMKMPLLIGGGGLLGVIVLGVVLVASGAFGPSKNQKVAEKDIQKVEPKAPEIDFAAIANEARPINYDKAGDEPEVPAKPVDIPLASEKVKPVEIPLASARKTDDQQPTVNQSVAAAEEAVAQEVEPPIETQVPTPLALEGIKKIGKWRDVGSGALMQLTPTLLVNIDRVWLAKDEEGRAPEKAERARYVFVKLKITNKPGGAPLNYTGWHDSAVIIESEDARYLPVAPEKTMKIERLTNVRIGGGESEEDTIVFPLTTKDYESLKIALPGTEIGMKGNVYIPLEITKKDLLKTQASGAEVAEDQAAGPKKPQTELDKERDLLNKSLLEVDAAEVK